MSENPAMKAARIAIVGAGPAGIRAAERLVAAGLHPIVIDEGSRAGGQIYRQPPEGFTRSPAELYGPEAGKASALHSLFQAMVADGRLTHHPATSVIALRDHRLHILGPDGPGTIVYDRLILATGASDRVAPIPGWQNAGIYTLGAMQIALKAQGLALGRRIVLVGSGPLLTLVGAQLVKAGAAVEAVLDTATWRDQASGFGDLLARPGLAIRGLGLRATLGRRYRAGVVPERIEANENGPIALHWRDARGRSHRTPCDAVGMGWHLKAETHLAGLAGCTFDYSERWHQWLPRMNALGRAGEGLYLAGDGARLLGADAAEVTGRLAASACLQDLGIAAPSVETDLAELARLERFAAGLARAFPWPAARLRDLADDTIICRCENVTAGAIREAVSRGADEANRAKSLSRLGMGRCQGRYCELAGAEVIAGAASCAAKEAGRLRPQAPIRPAPIAAYLPKS
ncbi:MAG: NAD(P)/FAD-dependent oxidoreductase [Beijerinckiaceae bacterium]|nr:NAD(P)/FAD-dependent oxidoreductase [Beijerinckiaceae bacterium]